MKETLEMDNRVLLLMKKPSMLCERVAGNDWAQESSQHSVESLLVPCREREVF